MFSKVKQIPLQWKILYSIIFGMIFISVNTTMIAIALKELSREFNVSIIETSWVATIYLVVMASFQPITGKLGDIFGKKKIYHLGMIIFLLTSILATLSTNIETLIIIRALQGFGGVLVLPNAASILRSATDEKIRPKIFGIYSSGTGIGAALGPFLGAILIDSFGWRSVFWVGVPFVIISLIFTNVLIPSDENKKANKKETLDIWGSILLATFMIVSILMAKEKIEFNILIIGLLLVAFVIREIIAKKPLIDFRFFKNINFTFSNFLILIANFFVFTTILAMPIIFEEKINMDIKNSGFLLTGFFIFFTIGTIIGGILASKFGSKLTVVLSYILQVISAVLYFSISADTSLSVIFLILSLGGYAIGSSFPIVQLLNIHSVEEKNTGLAQGIYQTFRYSGAVIASVLIGSYATDKILLVILITVVVLGLILTIFIQNKKELN